MGGVEEVGLVVVWRRLGGWCGGGWMGGVEEVGWGV